MRLSHSLAVLILAATAWALPAVSHADTVLYDDAGFVQGNQSFVQSFYISAPGTLTITLTDIPWLDTISGLTGFFSTTSGVVGSTFTGSETINVEPGTVYAHWFGDAQGSYDLGVLGVKIAFQPSITAVPIPASLCLFLSGLGILLAWQRRESLRLGAGV
jgi:hypothetical protein